MKFALSLICILWLVACCKPSNSSNTEERLPAEPPDSLLQLSYYQCDYAKKQYDTILSSGDGKQMYEVWGINTKDIPHLPDPHPFDSSAFIRRAVLHLQKRFSSKSIISSTYQTICLNDQDSTHLQNCFIYVSCLYDSRGYVEMVPILLDGRIILSSNEVSGTE